MDCVLSHEAAAELWGLIPAGPPVADRGPPRPRGPIAPEVAITVAGREPRTRAGLRIHRVPILSARDVRIRDGLPVTAPARTLLDLAGADHDDATVPRRSPSPAA